jgi:hypothetical protein
MAEELEIPATAGEAVARVQAIIHQTAVSANWRAFHVGIPADFANYVHRYLDAAGLPAMSA